MSEDPPASSKLEEESLQDVYKTAALSARGFLEDNPFEAPLEDADHTRYGLEGDEIPAYYKANAAGAKAGALVAGSLLNDKIIETEQERDVAEYRATHDSLTGLYNQTAFKEKLHNRVEQAVKEGETFGLLLIDLDGFKKINDIFGHSTGDETLKKVGIKLQEILRGTDIAMHAGRVGGDEFAFIVDGLSSKLDMENQQRRHSPLNSIERLRIVADKILETLEGVFDELPADVKTQLRSEVGTSIGESLWKQGKTDEQMYKEADENMFKNKQLQKRGR